MDYSDDKLQEGIDSSSEPGDRHKALKHYYQSCETAATKYIEENKPAIACGAGCSFCCKIKRQTKYKKERLH